MNQYETHADHIVITGFSNPYEGIQPATRFNANIPDIDYQFLKSINPEHGMVQTSITIIVIKLIHELKRRGITDYTSADEFKRFIVDFGFTTDPTILSGMAQRPTLGSVDQNPAVVPVGRGATSTGNQVPTAEEVTSGSASYSDRGGKKRVGRDGGETKAGKKSIGKRSK